MHVITWGRWSALALMGVGGLLTLVLMGSVALVSAKGHDGDGSNDDMIHACVDPSSGRMKIVSSADDCKKTEQALSWNAHGVKGDKGDPGAPGAVGPQGPKGDTGADGAPGTNGTNGIDGAKGDKGDPGTNGIDGAKGDKGDPGTNGTNGIDGAKGDKGDPGTNGTNGIDGAKGDKGDPGTGVSSLSDLAGLTCTLNGKSGTVATTLATDGTVTMKCVAAPTQVTITPTFQHFDDGDGWPFVVRNTGLAPATITGVAIDYPSGFPGGVESNAVILNNGCDGITLATDGFCIITVTVQAAPAGLPISVHFTPLLKVSADTAPEVQATLSIDYGP